MEENVFDGYKKLVFDGLATTMGYTAICNGVIARVLFNSPSVSEKLSEHSFDFDRPTLEFKITDWPGIKEQIEAKEDVKISLRQRTFYALKIDGIEQDGETYKVYLVEDKQTRRT